MFDSISLTEDLYSSSLIKPFSYKLFNFSSLASTSISIVSSSSKANESDSSFSKSYTYVFELEVSSLESSTL